MDKIKVVHDVVGHTLTVWFDDPKKEHICEETTEEVVLMKDTAGRVIGFELLHYRPLEPTTGLAKNLGSRNCLLHLIERRALLDHLLLSVLRQTQCLGGQLLTDFAQNRFILGLGPVHHPEL